MNHVLDTIRGFRRLPTAFPGQWLYLFAEEGVIYSEGQNRFAGLDAAGVSAYLAFEGGVSIGDLRRLNTEVSRGSASDDGLEAIEALTHGVFPAEETPDELPTPGLTGPGGRVSGASKTEIIEIGGIPLLLEYPSGQLEQLCRDYFKYCPASDKPARCRLYAGRGEDGWAIYVNDRKLLSLASEEQLGLGLMHAARTILYAEAEYDVAFHAAAVARGDCAVLLSAPRESGKSTLSAFLVARGFDLLTDEPALLHLDRSAVSALRVPISLKQGSWPLLQLEYPQLADAPVHVRSDGSRVLLAHPAEDRRAEQERSLKHILFPKYQPSAVGQIQRLPPLRALELLNNGGMLLGKNLGRTKFEDFLELVCRVPAHEIRYSSLQEAWGLLPDLC